MTKAQEKKGRIILTTAHHDYSKGLNAYAFFKTNDHVVGEDLVQDTFIKTWSYLVKGGKIELMKAFLYHVLNALIIDGYRKNDIYKKYETTSLDILHEKGFEPSVDHSERFFNVLDGKMMLGLIQKLPEKYKKVMRMRYIQDLSLKEISLITGKSKNTISVQAHRGLEKLKLLYKFS